ncbi:hypothetical protein GRF29_164g242368 [Pseudopithomyces chartarum]|uniref:NADP-dependent oxidoreductase domain-containing protein n=1 Tax=Pseudopithomyces chartarum TaxID=1892770 RepID=A0AAN6LNV2_9PLEO|nr:hypothetical protein GRF29_164g242368 [Pseudopithomyces chartarum]
MVKNRIILGLMTFGPDTEWGAKTTSLPEFHTFLDHFQSAGYSETDTARTYQNGIQESVTAAVGYKKRNLSIATKLYPHVLGKHAPTELRAGVEKSLKELQTDYVDIFYLHAPDRSVPFEETVGEIDRILAGGLFTGKYKAGQTEDPGKKSFVGEVYRQRYIRNGYLDALSIIEPVVTAHGLTLVETAMRWLIHHSALKMRTDGGNDGIIIGASSLAQLDNNLAVLEKGPLPKEVLDALDEGWIVAKGTVPDYWHMDLKYTYDTEEALFGGQKKEANRANVASSKASL